MSFQIIHVNENGVMVKAYVNIKLPEELAKEVDKLIKEQALGYRSRGEFVAEATRTLLIKIKSLERNEV